jgi:ACS family tartrate transporter-like MFS transporter
MSQTATSPPILDYAEPVRDNPELIRRIVRRLIPFLCLLYVVNYLDRTNVAMAKLQMLGDTGISEYAYGVGAGLFFLGYFLFEVPSNLILEKVGARIWLTRIMVTWGLISGAMMFVRGTQSFYALRFLLGLAEAGFFPGIVLYLTYWIPSSRRAGVMAAFLTSTAISGVLGNPLAGLLMKMNGIGGLHGWQWLFVIEGIIPVLLGGVSIMLLSDRPSAAKWLTADEVAWINAQLAREHATHEGHHIAEMKAALRGGRLWHLSVLYFMLAAGIYGFVFWAPTIIKSVAKLSDLEVGIYSAIPYLVAAISMVVIGWHVDRTNERRKHIAACALTAATGIAILPACHSLPTALAAMCLAAIGIWGSLGPVWALSTRFLRGSAAAGGIAIINSIGALAGFFAPTVIGRDRTSGLLMVAGALVCGAVLVMLTPRHVDRGHA